jgi:uncharacterized membrane protein (DUF2068 family)
MTPPDGADPRRKAHPHAAHPGDYFKPPGPRHPLPPSSDVARRAQRLIALFEASKGVLALAASIGLLSLLHYDLRRVAFDVIGHFGLDPDGHYPKRLLEYAEIVQHTSRLTLVGLATGYVVVRLAEAYGLWRDRAWAEWLGALSGAIYIPFEARHMIHDPTITSVLVVLANAIIVLFLLRQLHKRRAVARQAGLAGA